MGDSWRWVGVATIKAGAELKPFTARDKLCKIREDHIMSRENGLPHLSESAMEDQTEGSRTELTAAMAYDLAAIIYGFTERGAAVSVYRSRDGAALAIRIKSGKETKAYWVSPDDNHGDVFARIARDWGVDCTIDVLYSEVQRVAAEINENA